MGVEVPQVRKSRRRKPKGGQLSLRAIAGELAALGHLNEREKLFNPKSIAVMLATYPATTAFRLRQPRKPNALRGNGQRRIRRVERPCEPHSLSSHSSLPPRQESTHAIIDQCVWYKISGRSVIGNYSDKLSSRTSYILCVSVRRSTRLGLVMSWLTSSTATILRRD
jgi:hypothetical protein